MTRWRKYDPAKAPPAGRLLKVNTDGGTVAAGFFYCYSADMQPIFKNPETLVVYAVDSVDAWAFENEDHAAVDFEALAKPPARALDLLLDIKRHLIWIEARACPCEACKPENLGKISLNISGAARDEIEALSAALLKLIQENFTPPITEAKEKIHGKK